MNFLSCADIGRDQQIRGTLTINVTLHKLIAIDQTMSCPASDEVGNQAIGCNDN
jgi:hypothetical protein